ncbi:GNAT family N-acetyltransferase [Nesterenkonia muleiensis]|uniref:GNAT family N-acetyltransferase n=1 Tax=Nesterenkonia muleiensis TaxID=2282648 RepID=UPI000E718EC8|nr:GNAT family N-acetyltransferase [Nesterenkonia muleiensis]
MADARDTELNTPRLLLRAPTDDDVGFVLDTYSRSEVVRYIGTGETQTTHEQAYQRIERYRSQFGPGTGVWLVENHDGAPLGFALMKPIPFSEGVVAQQEDLEIGWHLHPEAWGSGFATEAAQALIDHARAVGHKRLVAVTHPDNTGSQAVARRLGMTHEGRTERYYNTSCELFTLDLYG